jgi:modulator of FtsH protease
MYRHHYLEQTSSYLLTGKIFQTYLLLTISIISYLFGTYVSISQNLVILTSFGSMLILLAVIITKSPIFLIIFSFMTGLSHNPMFLYLNMIDPTIISEALEATFIVFVGLTFIAYKTVKYNTFALYGLLYSCLSTILWLSILNIFYQNTLVDIILMYCSIIIFTGYIIVDTHMLLKKPQQNPVTNALQLFLDFINLFINLLRLLKYIKKK